MNSLQVRRILKKAWPYIKEGLEWVAFVLFVFLLGWVLLKM